MSRHCHEWSRLPDNQVVELVERGIKPLCVTASKQDTNLECIEVPQVYEEGIYLAEYTQYVYYPFGSKKKAERVAVLLKLNNFTPELHREFGLLMGYQEEKVDAWVNELYDNLSKAIKEHKEK